MAVRTNWHEDAATGGSPGLDPFQMPSSQSMAAAPLTLDLSKEELERRLGELLQREAHLDKEGVVCAIKENPEGTCLGCPLNEARLHSAKGSLCEIGCEQERVQTMMLAKNAQPKW